MILNGLLELQRDIVLKLVKIINDLTKIRMLMGMCEEIFIWRLHSFFLKIRRESHEIAKQSLREAVILPLQFLELFAKKRKPWKGILLFGPPGVGKSYVVKTVAVEVKATFFSLSSCDFMNTWVGHSKKYDPSKLIKQVCIQAREKRPSIIFIDDIDTIFGRFNEETETAHRAKTELLVQMEGVGANNNDKVIFLGVTNSPWDLDSAILHRFEKRIFISLPNVVEREVMFRTHLESTRHGISPECFHNLALNSEGYSCADIAVIVRDALMQPVRRLQNALWFKQKLVADSQTGILCMKYVPCGRSEAGARQMMLKDINIDEIYIPKVMMEDMVHALSAARPSVSQDEVARHVAWEREFKQM